MKVSTTQPFQIVYALYNHQYLGFLIESFVVQLDASGRFTLQHQNISSKNAADFGKGLDETDYTLIKLMDEICQDQIIQKFSRKKVSAAQFFEDNYADKPELKPLQQAISDYVDDRRAEILPLLANKYFFVMGNDGEPTFKRITHQTSPATVLFHFVRNHENTHYFPTIKHGGSKIDWQYKDGAIICNKPAWLLVEQSLYTFAKAVDGAKLRPFLRKKFIVIPRKLEASYYRKFIAQVIEHFDVHPRGFRIHTISPEPMPVLRCEVVNTASGSLFGNGPVADVSQQQVVFSLSFAYERFLLGHNTQQAHVELQQDQDQYVFFKVARKPEQEAKMAKALANFGLPIKKGRANLPPNQAFQWLGQYKADLIDMGFQIEQKPIDGKRYFIGVTSIDVGVSENKDWFDIHIKVRFGDHEVPFAALRKLIAAQKQEFLLPNGETAVIPAEWLSRYGDLFQHLGKDNETPRLPKYHLALLQALADEQSVSLDMNEKLAKLRDFEKLPSYEVPANFKGTLRPYQHAGYNWLRFLQEYAFGGCLADDMGLGKTVQTLALLQHAHQDRNVAPSLLVMPTSLLYNWEMEAKKFTPQLRVYVHMGSDRPKDCRVFAYFDLVLTSYGTLRQDADMLKQFLFNYIVLDESQAIKNPASLIAKSVCDLHAEQRLLLTGTPVENTTLDLWSQMNFANPGLLGGLAYFKKRYQNPIEKHGNNERREKLHAVIKPFILRRHKSQVATDLPGKVEKVHYCDMLPAQQKRYEEVKSSYRNELLDLIDQQGMAGSQIMVLKGLTLLRQLANHPQMVEEDYQEGSGKMDDVLHALESVLKEGHKVLVFSQFVKHLQLLKRNLDHQKIGYSYLDGATKDRQQAVNDFQENPKKPVFLISLKAGGVGLNLTAADYVFLLDPWWNPAVEQQAIDRAHRIGQNKKVFIYKFITRHTVEEKILELQEHKKQLADGLIMTEDSFMKKLSKTDVEALFA